MKRIIATLAFTILSTGLAHAELPSATDAVVRKALSSGKPTIIDLGSDSCIPCKQMAPILASLAGEYRGRANVLFININDDKAAAQKFRVQMIPTQVLFNAQGKEFDRHIGFMDKADLVKGLKAVGVK